MQELVQRWEVYISSHSLSLKCLCAFQIYNFSWADARIWLFFSNVMLTPWSVIVIVDWKAHHHSHDFRQNKQNAFEVNLRKIYSFMEWKKSHPTTLDNKTINIWAQSRDIWSSLCWCVAVWRYRSYINQHIRNHALIYLNDQSEFRPNNSWTYCVTLIQNYNSADQNSPVLDIQESLKNKVFIKEEEGKLIHRTSVRLKSHVRPFYLQSRGKTIKTHLPLQCLNQIELWVSPGPLIVLLWSHFLTVLVESEM